jgi:hypothetical protein
MCGTCPEQSDKIPCIPEESARATAQYRPRPPRETTHVELEDRLMRKPLITLAAAAVITLACGASSLAATSKPPLVLKTFGSFYVGGTEIQVPYTTGRPVASYGPDILPINQMYVQYLTPLAQRSDVPVVFVHGGALSGKTWEQTPDGRAG